MMARAAIRASCALLAAGWWGGALAQRVMPGQPDLASMSPEDLMKIEVTTASRKDQQLAQVPAAAFVITREDIRRVRRHQHTGTACAWCRACRWQEQPPASGR